MTTLELEDAAVGPAARPVLRPGSGREPIRVHGKFFFAGEAKYFVKGVTYGPFAAAADGTQSVSYTHLTLPTICSE